MKIVVLGLRGFPNVQGGVETHCEQLYTRMAREDHQVTVLCRKPYMPAGAHSHAGVRLVSLTSPRSKSLEAIVHTTLGVLYARFLGPDILHIHAIGPSLLVPLARLLGLRTVVTNHGADYDRQKWRGFAKSMLRAGESLGTRFANGVIAISQPIATHLLNEFRRRSCVIPNGVVIRTPSEAKETLEKFGLETGRYLLAVGRLVPEKGFHDLIEAFAKAAVPGWTLCVVGRADHEDDYSANLQALARATPGVVMTGFVSGEPLRQLYSHAGGFALPSYHEGLPIVLLEAMSFGLPVIASDIPANRQVELSDDCFFPAGDIARAATRLRSLALSRPTDAQRTERIAYVAKHFDWDTITERTLAFYRSLIPGRTGTNR